MTYADVTMAASPDVYYTFDELIGQFGRFPDHSGKGTTDGGVLERSSSTPWWHDNPTERAKRQGQPSLVRSNTNYSLRLFGGGTPDGVYAIDWGHAQPISNPYLNSPTIGISALIKPERLDIASTNAYVGYRILGRMPRHSEENPLWDLVISRTGRLEMRVWRSLQSPPSNEFTGEVRAIGTTQLQLGQTYHVAGSYDGSTVKVFLNGLLEGSISAPGAIPTEPDPVGDIPEADMVVGMGPDILDDPNYTVATTPFSFRGQVDEVAAWFTSVPSDQFFYDQYLASVEPATVLYQDTFNRANSTNVPGTPAVGGPYTVRTGTWGISNNQLYNSVSTAESQMTFPGVIDPDFQVKIRTLGNHPGLMWRWVDANNFWLLTMGSAPNLWRRVGGTYVQFTSGLPASIAGDTYRVVAQGKYIKVLRNGKTIASVEDPWFSSATATMGYRFNSDTTARLDDAFLGPAPTESLSADVPTIDTPDGAQDPGAFLYKGRDTKLADEGAVA